MLRHTSQEATNRLLAYTPGQGSLHWIFERRYLSQDIGRLFAYVRGVLERAQWPLVRYTDFHLVNVFSPFYQTSHGRCPPPPPGVVIPATRLVLTFSQTGRHYGQVRDLRKMRYNDWSCMWGDGLANAHDFFSIDVQLPEYRSFRFRPLLPPNLAHVYNLMSMLTKNFVVNYRRTPHAQAPTLHDYRNRLFDMHFGDFIKRVPWWLLPYNEFVWRRGTQLLTTMIDADAALYYALYLQGLNLCERAEGDLVSETLFGANSVKAVLAESIKRFVELPVSEPSVVDLVFPAFLFPDQGSGYLASLTRRRQEMLALTAVADDPRRWCVNAGLSDYGAAAESLIRGRRQIPRIFGA